MSLAYRNGSLIYKSGALGTGAECCCGGPPPPPPECSGPCCIAGSCSSETKGDCIAAGGTFIKCDELCEDYDCAALPSCASLDCETTDYSTAVVTVNLNTFGFINNNSGSSCNATYRDVWISRAEDLNGTYTLSRINATTYEYTEGTPGTTGYLVVTVITSSSLSTSVLCPLVAQVSISLINLSDSGPEFYYANNGVNECLAPSQLSSSSIGATSASTALASTPVLDMCDGTLINSPATIAGRFLGVPNCSAAQCNSWNYSGTVDVELVA